MPDPYLAIRGMDEVGQEVLTFSSVNHMAYRALHVAHEGGNSYQSGHSTVFVRSSSLFSGDVFWGRHKIYVQVHVLRQKGLKVPLVGVSAAHGRCTGYLHCRLQGVMVRCLTVRLAADGSQVI
ncbi:hypothetical protein FKM82_030129 [Ascaphus truei]